MALFHFDCFAVLSNVVTWIENITFSSQNKLIITETVQFEFLSAYNDPDGLILRRSNIDDKQTKHFCGKYSFVN